MRRCCRDGPHVPLRRRDGPPAWAATAGTAPLSWPRCALAAPVVSPARPRKRARGRPAHRHATRDVVPTVVSEVGQVRAAGRHELALHGGEEEGAAVEAHGVLPTDENVAGGAVVAGAAGVEQHGGLRCGVEQRDEEVGAAPPSPPASRSAASRSQAARRPPPPSRAFEELRRGRRWAVRVGAVRGVRKG